MSEGFQPPRKSDPSRGISLRSSHNYRGSYVDHVQNREIAFESRLELHMIMLLVASEAFDKFEEQPEAVEYVDDDGVAHQHTFDLFGVTKDGLRVLIDVKPKDRVESSGILTVQRLIREQHGTALADRILLRTDEHIHPDDVADAAMVIRARRMPCAEADRVVEEMVSKVSGWVRVADLVEASGLRARAFNAVVRLVGAGKLEVRDDERISYAAEVRRRSH